MNVTSLAGILSPVTVGLDVHPLRVYPVLVNVGYEIVSSYLIFIVVVPLSSYPFLNVAV